MSLIPQGTGGGGKPYKGDNPLVPTTTDQTIDKGTLITEPLVISAVEDVTPEVTAQTPLVAEILESLVGKVTLANATPDKIVKGYSAYVKGALVEGNLAEKTIDYKLGRLPYEFYGAPAIIYQGEIHILGYGGTGVDSKKHYKWDGTRWIEISTLPFSFNDGGAIVFNGEIHILGSGTSGDCNKHYKWDGTKWAEVSTLPVQYYGASPVIYNGEIHIVGGGNANTWHYKWDETAWTSVSTLPYSFARGAVVIYKNDIHILGSIGNSNERKHYKYNGTAWTEVEKLTVDATYVHNSSFVYNDEINIVGGASNNGYIRRIWNGSEWRNGDTLPYNKYRGGAIAFNDEIHLIGGGEEFMSRRYHYVLGRKIYTEE